MDNPQIKSFKSQLNDAYGRLMDATARNNEDDFQDALTKVESILRIASKKLPDTDYQQLVAYSNLVKTKLKQQKKY